MKKIIIPTGYMGSGSSAVTDLISEFENVNNEYGSFEYVFLHCPNGVFDLEDKLLIGNNTLRSDEAIHTFLSTMKNLYNKKYWWVGNYIKIIGKDFYKITESYVNELCDYKLDDYWYMQENTNFKMLLKLIINKFINCISLKKISGKKPLLYKKMFLSYPTKTKFYKVTKKYIDNVLNLMDTGNDDLLLDQLLLPHNLKRINNYFSDEIRVIVVDRDPRDVFILNKYIWPTNKETVPYSRDVKEFCEQFKAIRNIEEKIDDKKVLRIHFEDLIYKYEDTSKKIISFLEYKNRKQIYKQKKFDPSKSIKNTQLFKESKYEKEIEYIENNLKEFLYDFIKS